MRTVIATKLIQSPTYETDCPNQSSKKSRFWRSEAGTSTARPGADRKLGRTDIGNSDGIGLGVIADRGESPPMALSYCQRSFHAPGRPEQRSRKAVLPRTILRSPQFSRI